MYANTTRIYWQGMVAVLLLTLFYQLKFVVKSQNVWVPVLILVNPNYDFVNFNRF